MVEEDRSVLTEDWTGGAIHIVVPENGEDEAGDDVIETEESSDEEPTETLLEEKEANDLRSESLPCQGLFSCVVNFAVEAAYNFGGVIAIVASYTFRAVLWIAKIGAAVAAGLCTLTVAYVFLHGLPDKPNPASPNNDLQTFVHAKKRDVAAELSIEDIKTETYESYAATYCLEGITLERTRDALRIGLQDVPESVRNDIVTKALQDGITGKNTWRNSRADLINSSKAYSYMAFYSTSFEPRSNGMDIYKTCVMVTGVTFTVAEQIVAYEEIEEEVIIGTKLECTGFFFSSCNNIPKYGMRKTRVPVLKRSALSLKEQKELHNWMVTQAIESAGHLVGDGSPSLDGPGTGSVPDNGSSDWKWNPPQYTAEL